MPRVREVGLEPVREEVFLKTERESTWFAVRKHHNILWSDGRFFSESGWRAKNDARVVGGKSFQSLLTSGFAGYGLFLTR